MTIREQFEESALSRGLVVRRVFGYEAEAEGLEAGDYLFQKLGWLGSSSVLPGTYAWGYTG